MTPSLERSDRPLALSRSVLGLLIKLNLMLGILIFGLLISTLVAQGPVMQQTSVLPAF